MSEHHHKGAPWWFWVIGAVALVWNLMGVGAYLAQVSMDEATLAAMPAAERLMYETVPVWATAAFAIAVFGGVLASVVLLLQRAWALHLFGMSLLAVIVQMSHAFFMSEAMEVYGPGGMVMPALVLLLAVFFVWFAIFSRGNGWLK